MTRARSAVDGIPPSTPVRPARPKDAVQSLERAIAVLTTFDREHRDLTLTEVADRCRLPRSAARRFLHTLVELGFVEVSGRKFTLTPQVLTLATPICRGSPWPTCASRTSRHLRETWKPPRP